MTLLCSQLTASLKPAVQLLLCGDWAALLRRKKSGAAHSKAGRMWRASSTELTSKHMRDVTGVKFCWACLSSIKETLENFKLRDNQSGQPQGHSPGPTDSEQLDRQEDFKLTICKLPINCPMLLNARLMSTSMLLYSTIRRSTCPLATRCSGHG